MGVVRPGVATLGRVRGRGPPRQRWEGWSRNMFRRNLAVLPPSHVRPESDPISRPGAPQTHVRPDFDPISRPGASQTHVRPDFDPISRPGASQTHVRPDFGPISRPGAPQTRVRPDFGPVSRPSYEKSQIFIVFRKIIYFLCERNILNELYYDRMVDFT